MQQFLLAESRVSSDKPGGSRITGDMIAGISAYRITGYMVAGVSDYRITGYKVAGIYA